MVLVIIGILTLIAVPAMRTFTSTSYDLSAATRITHTINRAKDQARRRNRAYIIDFALLVAAAGWSRITSSKSCCPIPSRSASSWNPSRSS